MTLFVSFNYSFYAIRSDNDIVIKLKGAMSFFLPIIELCILWPF